MALLEVDSAGLRVLAAHCNFWGAEIGARSARGSVMAGWQATAAAVAALHADVAVASQVMVARMNESAANLSTAGTVYVATDERAAGRLSGMATGV